jgi:hypothetical protein
MGALAGGAAGFAGGHAMGKARNSRGHRWRSCGKQTGRLHKSNISSDRKELDHKLNIY